MRDFLTSFQPDIVSVTTAAGRGVPGLVKDAEAGHDVVVSRHGRQVAAVISMARLDQLRELQADLRDAALVLSRELTDNGNRTDLGDVVTMLGFDRAELEAELDADIAAGRE